MAPADTSVKLTAVVAPRRLWAHTPMLSSTSVCQHRNQHATESRGKVPRLHTTPKSTNFMMSSVLATAGRAGFLVGDDIEDMGHQE